MYAATQQRKSTSFNVANTRCVYLRRNFARVLKTHGADAESTKQFIDLKEKVQNQRINAVESIFKVLTLVVFWREDHG